MSMGRGEKFKAIPKNFYGFSPFSQYFPPVAVYPVLWEHLPLVDIDCAVALLKERHKGLPRFFGQKRGDYIASAAKHSKLPESEIENFERQALSSDCYILRLTEGLDRALSNASNKDGLSGGWLLS